MKIFHSEPKGFGNTAMFLSLNDEFKSKFQGKLRTYTHTYQRWFLWKSCLKLYLEMPPNTKYSEICYCIVYLSIALQVRSNRFIWIRAPALCLLRTYVGCSTHFGRLLIVTKSFVAFQSQASREKKVSTIWATNQSFSRLSNFMIFFNELTFYDSLSWFMKMKCKLNITIIHSLLPMAMLAPFVRSSNKSFYWTR